MPVQSNPLHCLTDKVRRLSGATILAFVACASHAGGAAPGVNTGYFGNVAIQGYDPVAYFLEQAAVKGSSQHSHKWLGATWHFSSDANRERFASSPIKYAPQYGGHCASGMGVHGGTTKDIDPEAWAIVDGKLYLNYSQETNRLLKAKVIDLDKADANWRKLEGE